MKMSEMSRPSDLKTITMETKPSPMAGAPIDTTTAIRLKVHHDGRSINLTFYRNILHHLYLGILHIFLLYSVNLFA